ncbi:hypothetical protein DFJ73DRAFT_871161 [Zopfochytrium polystomum]|nr:hypothetical protein DFJ73DRAFT_871161 [Zopfochytrium polystomum]
MLPAPSRGPAPLVPSALSPLGAIRQPQQQEQQQRQLLLHQHQLQPHLTLSQPQPRLLLPRPQPLQAQHHLQEQYRPPIRDSPHQYQQLLAPQQLSSSSSRSVPDQLSRSPSKTFLARLPSEIATRILLWLVASPAEAADCTNQNRGCCICRASLPHQTPSYSSSVNYSNSRERGLSGNHDGWNGRDLSAAMAANVDDLFWFQFDDIGIENDPVDYGPIGGGGGGNSGGEVGEGGVASPRHGNGPAPAPAQFGSSVVPPLLHPTTTTTTTIATTTAEAANATTTSTNATTTTSPICACGANVPASASSTSSSTSSFGSINSSPSDFYLSQQQQQQRPRPPRRLARSAYSFVSDLIVISTLDRAHYHISNDEAAWRLACQLRWESKKHVDARHPHPLVNMSSLLRAPWPNLGPAPPVLGSHSESSYSSSSHRRLASLCSIPEAMGILQARGVLLDLSIVTKLREAGISVDTEGYSLMSGPTSATPWSMALANAEASIPPVAGQGSRVTGASRMDTDEDLAVQGLLSLQAASPPPSGAGTLDENLWARLDRLARIAAGSGNLAQQRGVSMCSGSGSCQMECHLPSPMLEEVTTPSETLVMSPSNRSGRPPSGGARRPTVPQVPNPHSISSGRLPAHQNQNKEGGCVRASRLPEFMETLLAETQPRHAPDQTGRNWQSRWKASFMVAEKDSKRVVLSELELLSIDWSFGILYQDIAKAMWSKFYPNSIYLSDMHPGRVLSWRAWNDGSTFQMDQYPPLRVFREEDWGFKMTNNMAILTSAWPPPDFPRPTPGRVDNVDDIRSH